jgi:putative flippase GtrA
MNPLASVERPGAGATGGARQKAARREFLEYFAASLVSLAVDLGIFSALLRVAGLSWFWAATIGFCAGVLTAYWLSVRWVFSSRRLGHAPRSEFGLFAAIGVVGLGVTQAVLWVGIETLHLQPELVKLVAAGATFLFNFAVRKSLLFRRGPGART